MIRVCLNFKPQYNVQLIKMAAKKAVVIYNLVILTLHSILESYFDVFCQAVSFSKRNELGKIVLTPKECSKYQDG